MIRRNNFKITSTRNSPQMLQHHRSFQRLSGNVGPLRAALGFNRHLSTSRVHAGAAAAVGSSTMGGSSSSTAPARLPAFSINRNAGRPAEDLPTGSVGAAAGTGRTSLHSLLAAVRAAPPSAAEGGPSSVVMTPLSPLLKEPPAHLSDDILSGGIPVKDPEEGLSKERIKEMKEAWLKQRVEPNIVQSKLDEKHYRVQIPTVGECDTLHVKAKRMLGWRLQMNKAVDSDGGMNETPQSADYLFIAFTGLEFMFLLVNLATTSPFVFEKCMCYHLSYTSMALTWWAASVSDSTRENAVVSGG